MEFGSLMEEGISIVLEAFPSRFFTDMLTPMDLLHGALLRNSIICFVFHNLLPEAEPHPNISGIVLQGSCVFLVWLID